MLSYNVKHTASGAMLFNEVPMFLSSTAWPSSADAALAHDVLCESARKELKTFCSFPSRQHKSIRSKLNCQLPLWPLECNFAIDLQTVLSLR